MLATLRWSVGLLLLCNLGCKPQTPPEPTGSKTQGAATRPAAAPAPAAATQPAGGGAADGPGKAEALEIYMSRCTPCHAADGSGNGPVSAALSPKPRDFRDPEWQKSVSDTDIDKVIVEGGPAVGKAPTMPPNPDLGQKPEVLKAMREHIRAMKK